MPACRISKWHTVLGMSVKSVYFICLWGLFEILKSMWMVLVTVAFCLLFGVFLFISQLKKSKPDNAKSVAEKSTHKEPNTYTRSEISMHNKGSDCWIIIKDKVYDVTSYVEEHPGGDAILDHAGDDSTEGFFGPQHATRVFDMIDEFYIGDLKQ